MSGRIPIVYGRGYLDAPVEGSTSLGFSETNWQALPQTSLHHRDERDEPTGAASSLSTFYDVGWKLPLSLVLNGASAWARPLWPA